jgi:O-antigen/teichoic acid export membrane protein
MTPSEEEPFAAPLAGTPAPDDSTSLAEETSRLMGRGTMIMIASTLAFFTLTFAGYVIAARILPVTEWGKFSLGVAFTSFLSVVIILGLNNAVARTLVLEPTPQGRYAIVRWSLWVSAGLSIAASIATYFLATPISLLFHEAGLVPVLQILAASVGLGAITPMFCAVFQGFQDMLPNALFNQVLNPAVFLVLVVGLLVLGWGLEGALVAYLVADILGFAASVLYYQRRIHRHLPVELRGHGRPSRVLWLSAIALWGVSSLAFITAYADTLFLGAYRSVLDVGYYSTAMTLARTLLLAGSALTFVFLPLAARLARQRQIGLLRTAYTVATRWILVVSIPLFLLFFLLPSESVTAIFGAKYLPAAGALQLLSLTAFVASLVGPSNACLAGLERDRAQLASAGFSAVTNVALSFALIPTYGVIGAAIAWGVARALYPLACLVILYRDYGIHPFRPILVRPLALTLGITAPVFLAVRLLISATWVVYPLFFVALGVFLVSMLVTRSFLPDDLVFVRAGERILGVRFSRLRALVRDRSALPGVS